MARPEAAARDAWLAAVGAVPGVMVYRSEVVLGEHWQRSLPDGHPDVVLCVCGHVVLCEWKSKTGTLSDKQRRFHAAWQAAGGTVWVCRDGAEVVGWMLPLAKGETLSALETILHPLSIST